MKKQLIILTGKTAENQAPRLRPEDSGAEVIDLTSAEVDYSSLVQKIFEADSVHVW
jgi:hypothetical protein